MCINYDELNEHTTDEQSGCARIDWLLLAVLAEFIAVLIHNVLQISRAREAVRIRAPRAVKHPPFGREMFRISDLADFSTSLSVGIILAMKLGVMRPADDVWEFIAIAVVAWFVFP